MVGVLAVSRFCQIRRFFLHGDEPIYPDHDFPVPGYLLSPAGILVLMFGSTPSASSSVSVPVPVPTLSTSISVASSSVPVPVFTPVAVASVFGLAYAGQNFAPIPAPIVSASVDTPPIMVTTVIYADSNDPYEMENMEGSEGSGKHRKFLIKWKSKITGLSFGNLTREPLLKIHRDPVFREWYKQAGDADADADEDADEAHAKREMKRRRL